MTSRNKTDVKKLFEFWCEVSRAHGVDRRIRSGQDAPAGIIVESFPENFRDEKTIASIPTFAFPCDFQCESMQTFSFVLTTDDSKWRFGFCRYDPRTDSVMVLVTYLPWHETFFKLLTVLHELRRSNDYSEFSAFLREAYASGIPEPKANLKLFYEGGQKCFVFEHPSMFKLPSIPESCNLNLYYNFVDARNMIAVFAAMLAERRIIFTSRRLDRLSACIQAANAFLYPMVWQHIFIPVLPMKLKDYLGAPMPYLIGVPDMVLETMTTDELCDVVIFNCDTNIFKSPFDDVHEMPEEIVAQLKKQLNTTPGELVGDRVSKIFLGALVQLIGGYRDAVEFRATSKKFNRDKFIESRPSYLRPFLSKMMELQIFQQFIDERLEMLNTGLGFSDEFEEETVRYAEKMKKRGLLKTVKDKTNPAVKSAVKSVKEGSRGVKTVYKDLKSKFRDITPPNNPHFRSHLAANIQHDRIDGYIGGSKKSGPHHSAPSSPIFSKRDVTAGGFQYVNAKDINGAAQYIRRQQPLVTSSTSAHLHPNGHAGAAHGAVGHAHHLAASPTVSPASSLCSSEMNLSQELQNHPLFKTPVVDRSLKPSHSLELNHHCTSTGGGLPLRPPPPAAHLLQATALRSAVAPPPPPPSYYNHPYASHTCSQKTQTRANSHYHAHPHVEDRPPQVPRAQALRQQALAHRVAGHSHSLAAAQKIITTASIFDNPPEMLSPPVPPRRQGTTGDGQKIDGSVAVAATAAAVSAGIHRLKRNCWNEYDEGSCLQHNDALCSSLASNTSASSSSSGSSASFVSAASTVSNRPLRTDSRSLFSRAPASLPVPAPRHKKDKESLRSLQPQHMQLASNPAGSLHSAAPSSSASQEDTMNDLITLDDSHNTSFDLEDFDPLNQNARPFPSGESGSGAVRSKKSTTLPSGSRPAMMTASSANNPLYPYYVPQPARVPLHPPPLKPPPLPTSLPPPMPPPDDDFELLRKYGLDQFTLTTVPNGSNGNGSAMIGGMCNWTTFD